MDTHRNFQSALANRAQQVLKKGSKIYVSGAWKTRNMEDNKLAPERSGTELTFQTIRDSSFRSIRVSAVRNRPRQEQVSGPGFA